MGVKDSLVAMLGDFVQMNKNPEYRSKTDLSQSITSLNKTEKNPVVSEIVRSEIDTDSIRRHSISIHVGSDGPTDAVVRHRTYSVSNRASLYNRDKAYSENKEVAALAKMSKRNSTGMIDVPQRFIDKLEVNETSPPKTPTGQPSYRLFSKARPKSVALSEDEEGFEKSFNGTAHPIVEESEELENTPINHHHKTN
uniref:Uncharacterized protein n=1 Tax=Rhabditophanes sp. KR3021 TaxID=114890 RepID=A0AC35UEP2_9BILA